MTYIRIARTMGRDYSVQQIAEELDVAFPHALGCCVLVFAELPSAALTGDVSAVCDGVLESWAHWQGARGAFAAAFRRCLCTSTGTVRSWGKHNGGIVIAKARRRDSARTRRSDRAGSVLTTTTTTTAPSVTLRCVPATVTAQAGQESLGFDVPFVGAAVPRPKVLKVDRAAPNRYPHFPIVDREAAYETWTSCVGVMEFSRLMKAIGPLWAAPEATHRPDGPLLLWALDRYCRSVMTGNSAPYVSPEKAGASLIAIARTKSQHTDPMALMDAIDTIVHGRPGK